MEVTFDRRIKYKDAYYPAGAAVNADKGDMEELLACGGLLGADAEDTPKRTGGGAGAAERKGKNVGQGKD